MLLRVIEAGESLSRGCLLVPGVALVMLRGAGQSGLALGVSLDGRTPLPPYGTVEVGSARDPARLAAFRLPHTRAAPAPRLTFTDGDDHQPLLASDLHGDALTLATGLDQAAKRKLLDFFITFCCPAFRLQRSALFAQVCARLAHDCAEPVGKARLVAQVTADHVLVDGVPAVSGAALVVIGHDRITRNRLPTLQTSTGLQVVPRPAAGDLIVATGAALATWTVEGPATLPHVFFLSENGPVSAAAARAACSQALLASQAAAAPNLQDPDLLRDMDLLFPATPRRLADPAQPVAGEVELAVPDGAGGVFLSGWLRDPLERIAEIALATSVARLALHPDALVRVRRPDIEKRFASGAFPGTRPDGFVLHVPELPGGHTLQPHLLLRLRSGAEVRLTPAARSLPAAAARQAVLGSVALGQLSSAIMRRCLAPATMRLHRAAMARTGKPDIIRMGGVVAKPPVSIIVPLYRNLSFLRLQLAAFAEDPRCRKAEIIFVLDSPEQRSEVEHLLRGLFRLTGLPVTLVIMPANLGYAAACNAGGQVARAPLFLLLNSDVIPPSPGWLAVLMAPLSSAAVTAVGPKLLFDDSSIQHAGLFFERDEDGLWFNRHYHKGMPRHWPSAAVRRPVPGVTGAALLVRRTMFEWVGGICEDYVIGDYEDSDFCLRMRASGGRTLYVPQAELFHFERRSIQLHQGYTRTHAALYNRLLHHDRWDAAMEQAMVEASRPSNGAASGRAA